MREYRKRDDVKKRQAEYWREYIKTEKGKRMNLEWVKRWQRKNPQKVREYKRKWYLKNRERILAQQREYRKRKKANGNEA